jgi:folate-binding protein YgfZ
MSPATDYDRARTDAALFDVSDRGKVEVSGPEAPNFLHNLSTNDILNLPLGAGCEAFFTTNKAKVVSYALIYHVRISGGKDALWLDVDAGQAQRLIDHLNHFLIAEQVEIGDRTADFSQFLLAGPRAKAVLEDAIGQSMPDLGPLQHLERTIGASATCHVRRHDPLCKMGFDLVCLRSRADDVRRRLIDGGALPAGADTYEVMRVEAGTPLYGRDIDDNRFAVEVGRTNAVSYSKGCYLGQEPIVMARDRAGHVNRYFRGLKFASAAAEGMKLVGADDQPAGVVTSAVESPRLGPIGLGYVRRGSEQGGVVLKVESSGETVTVSDLPMA